MTTIILSDESELRLRDAVRSGRFATIDDALAEATRLLAGEPDPASSTPQSPAGPGPDLVLGSMREYADDLDRIVAEAYRLRREKSWRELNLG